MPAIVDTSELDHFEGALRDLQEIAMPLAEEAIGVLVEQLHEFMAVYPSQPDRDRANPGDKPHPYNTYVRGIGQFPRSAFAQVNSKWQRKQRGAYKAGPKGGKVRRTSQRLDKRWRVRVYREGGGVVGELHNSASYSGVVLGHKGGGESGDGIPNQAPFHTETGWPSIDDGMAYLDPLMDKALNTVVDKVFEELAES